jgi:hypothetical protein
MDNDRRGELLRIVLTQKSARTVGSISFRKSLKKVISTIISCIIVVSLVDIVNVVNKLSRLEVKLL